MAMDNKVMVYNGEVYNYKEIRLELQNYGIKFFSDSDTSYFESIYSMGY